MVLTYHTVQVTATRAAVGRALQSLPQEARRGGPVADAIMLRAGYALLGRVRRAFVVKARGGTDDAGDSWVPLSPRTIARRRGPGRGDAGRQVEILRDTGLLLNSITPGSGSTNQVARPGRGEVVVGTNLKRGIYQHEGTSRIPQRRLWPPVNKWPSTWWQDILEQVRGGLVDLALRQIQRARGK